MSYTVSEGNRFVQLPAWRVSHGDREVAWFWSDISANEYARYMNERAEREKQPTENPSEDPWQHVGSGVRGKVKIDAHDDPWADFIRDTVREVISNTVVEGALKKLLKPQN